MSLALSSLGAVPTEQKVFKQSKRQEGSLSRRKKILLTFLECRAAAFKRDVWIYFEPSRHCTRANRHQPSVSSPKGKRQIDGQWSRSLNRLLPRWECSSSRRQLLEICATYFRIGNLRQVVNYDEGR
ncbi:MAG: hypothetical protein QOI53_4465 [Verrucomicrobiota bacterium]|jgi:hypothetical protein|nr:hypothetical protein [Verrucomicrobiota bacterium]